MVNTIHLGHHFYGAGNLGDDFMLAGFLAALPSGGAPRFTCCVPHPAESLRRRFPAVDWLPYEVAARRRAIARADLWLGLGGSPFQSAVSRWFVDHLDEEARMCAAARKPMYFLGVGGQDPAAYALPEIRRVLAQAEATWTRDPRTAEAAAAAGARIVHSAADLAHLFFSTNPPSPPAPGRLTTFLNFDYTTWPALEPVIAALDGKEAEGAPPRPGPFAAAVKERVWGVQESRLLPGAEKALWTGLSPQVKEGWRIHEADREGRTLAEAWADWPSGEWLLSSRYHATLAGAWAGSRTVILATNEKLRGAADETGFASFGLDDDPSRLPALLATALPASRPRLAGLADRAKSACREFWSEVERIVPMR